MIEKIIGIDIGGTSIKGGIVNNGIVENKQEIMMEPEKGLNGFKEKLFLIIQTLLKIDNINLIGVSSVGNINIYTGEIINTTDYINGLIGFNIIKFIKDNFNKESYVINDAVAALYGELEYGAGKNKKDVCMLTLGTGVGGSVAINGEPLVGNNFKAGYLGHMTLYPGGKKCNCGRYGCVEPYLSGRAFTQGVNELGYNIKGIETFDLIKKGDKILDNYCKDFFKNLVYVCESLENIFDPEVIIIGGGLSNSYDDWKKYLLPNLVNVSTEILPASLKNDAGIIGASVFAKRNSK